MIPFRPTLERVWRQRTALAAERLDCVPMVVHLDPCGMAELQREFPEAPFAVPSSAGAITLLGFPVRCDPRLPYGVIVFRYEVQA